MILRDIETKILDFTSHFPVVVLLGPRQVGKTTLAKKLSEINDICLVEEYARKYLNENENKYRFNDLLKIAQKQYQNEIKY